MSDWVDEMFSGPGLELPTDEERGRADALVAEWAERWGEEARTVPRRHPDVTAEGFANYLAGAPTNRAFLRAQLRRWWRGPAVPEGVKQASLTRQYEHVDQIARDACLEVMGSDGILGILIDREVISEGRILALTADDVVELYDSFIGLAVDSVEDYLLGGDS